MKREKGKAAQVGKLKRVVLYQVGIGLKIHSAADKCEKLIFCVLKDGEGEIKGCWDLEGGK